MKKRFSFLALAVLLAFFTSCSFSNIEKESSLAIDLSSLRTTLSASYSDLSYCIVSIEPKVQNDIKIDFSKGESKASFKVHGPGSYKVMISGYNADDLKIAYGESDLVEVKPLSTTKATVRIHRLGEKPLPEDFVKVLGVNITGTETWEPASSLFVSGRQLTIPDLIVCDHEVTRGEFVAVMGESQTQQFMTDLADYLTNVYDKDNNVVTGDDLLNIPMSRVNWYHAIAYCNKLSLKEGLTPCYSVKGITDWAALDFNDIPGYSHQDYATGDENIAVWATATCDFSANGYRLPTQAEWEWLARGGNDHTEFAGSDNIDEVGWYQKGDDWGPHHVKSLNPNGYGLYDMTGNVYEWCWDRDSYPITSSTPATGDFYGIVRVARGGSFFQSASECSLISESYTVDSSCEKEFLLLDYFGFRVVRTSSPVTGYDAVDNYNWYDIPVDVSTGKPATSSSSYVYFGVFPQTVLPTNSSVVIDESNKINMGPNTYYKGSDGNWYAKVVENAYGTTYTYSDGTTVNQASASKTRYFKVEPIKWKVLTPDYNGSGNALLLADQVLTGNIPYYKATTSRTLSVSGANITIQANDYKYSAVRAYLNGKYESSDYEAHSRYRDNGFIQAAFTARTYYLIPNTEVKNSADTASYDSSVTLKTNTCEDTLDKIFLLSLSEVTNEAYGFDPYVTTNNADLNTTRHRAPTDFAKANNVTISSNRATWWLRSPFGTESTASTEAVRTVSYQGAVNGSNGPANTMYYGLLPALTIKLQ